MVIKNPSIYLLLVFTILQGCDSYLVFSPRFVNNTGNTLTILTYDTVSSEKRYVVEAGSSVVTSFPSRLKIVQPTMQWSYDLLPLLPKSPVKIDPTLAPYVQTLWNNSHIINVQIQPDGSLYVLKAASDGMIITPPPLEQPQGFPMRPTIGG
jgi:hypothetical protein